MEAEAKLHTVVWVCPGVWIPTVLYPNDVPRSQGRSERSERAEQRSEHFWACSGHRTLDFVRRTLYGGLCTLDIGLILATYPVDALDVTVRNQNQN